jgi:MFS transporter, SP family, sugar:H+ symporter
VEHYGRRKSLIYGAAWMFVCFMIFASVGHFSLNRNDPQATEKSGTAMIVFACLFILGFASTWGPMVWTICAELYPARYRARAMALSTSSNWGWNFLLAFFTPFIVGDIDFRYGYIFAGCLSVAAAVVYFFVIEGQGRTLEEIDTMYLMNVVPWKSAEWVAPLPEELVTTEKLVTGGRLSGVTATNGVTNGATLEETASNASMRRRNEEAAAAEAAHAESA